MIGAVPIESVQFSKILKIREDKNVSLSETRFFFTQSGSTDLLARRDPGSQVSNLPTFDDRVAHCAGLGEHDKQKPNLYVDMYIVKVTRVNSKS